ncbi:hypothetical protein SCRM01_282 [Synechococcus phage S-CRM01]|uniref:hypothetical protein n=1 Tax=Synechococcus phage S-CRM01 TaxID=1026955 RepID=UPI000209E316|nr:hypothetical protein SCRM01_282 [Synechococcus phage S-CRM01]AEC53228.1 hypothetical protein SCRM01_282 [Synechococcus phage S-CRM01]
MTINDEVATALTPQLTEEELDEIIDNIIKPPLGLRPWWIVAESRRAEIYAAILRYQLAKKRVPLHWRFERILLKLLLFLSK